jgi:hypothetical protein
MASMAGTLKKNQEENEMGKQETNESEKEKENKRDEMVAM